MEEEEEEEHAEVGTNDKLVNSTVDYGMRRNGGCGHSCTAIAAVVAAVTVWSGHVVSANLVQAYHGADIRSNMPTDVKLHCTPHHLINVVDPPIIVVIVIVDDVIILYDTIFYS